MSNPHFLMKSNNKIHMQFMHTHAPIPWHAKQTTLNADEAINDEKDSPEHAQLSQSSMLG